MRSTDAWDVHVLSTAHDVADVRLLRLCEALLESGSSVLLEAIGERTDHAPVGVAVVLHPASGRITRTWRSMTRPLASPARCLVVVDPDTVPSAVVWRHVRRRRRLVVDVHEDYEALLKDRAWARGPAGVFAGMLVKVVRRLVAGADMLVVADHHLLPGLPRRLVVRNLPRIDAFACSGRDVEPRAVYIGDLRASRGLAEMVRAISAAPPWRLDLVGPVSHSDRAWVLDHAAAAGRPDAVRFHGRLPSGQAWAVARGAWAGLALLHDTPAYRAAIPTKVYEYAATGLPTLASPLPRVVDLLVQSGGGVIVDSVQKASDVLRWWAADPAACDRIGKRARAWAETELTEAPFAELAERVRCMLAASRE